MAEPFRPVDSFAELPPVGAEELCSFPRLGMGAVRRLDERRYVGVVPFLFTHGLIVGDLGDEIGYSNRWCYERPLDALVQLVVWDGEGEPRGWHRHPVSGRRRPEGDPEQEYVRP